MADINVMAMLGVTISVLIGSGGVGFFLRYGTRLSLIEKMIENSQLVTLHPRMIRLEDALQEIKDLPKKLAVLDILNTKLDGLKDSISTIVPRKEIEAHLDAIYQRLKQHDA